MRMKGTWPGLVTLRSGWAKAVARPWNEAGPDVALRLERGSAEFLVECVEHLCGFGAGLVLSPPVDPSSRQVWVDAGFADHLALDLYSRSILEPVATPEWPISVGTTDEWDRATTIDDAAFEGPWRMGRVGLEEARDATPRAVTLVAREGETVIGFVIVGCAVATAYLQRLAVDPAHTRKGVGRDLVRAAVGWAAGQGAVRIVLNTQPDNRSAAALYRSEGFDVAAGALTVLARAC